MLMCKVWGPGRCGERRWPIPTARGSRFSTCLVRVRPSKPSPAHVVIPDPRNPALDCPVCTSRTSPARPSCSSAPPDMDNTGTDPRSRTRTNLAGWKHRKHLHTVPCSSHQRLYTHSVGAKKRLRLHIARLQEFGLEFGLAARLKSPTKIASITPQTGSLFLDGLMVK